MESCISLGRLTAVINNFQISMAFNIIKGFFHLHRVVHRRLVGAGSGGGMGGEETLPITGIQGSRPLLYCGSNPLQVLGVFSIQWVVEKKRVRIINGRFSLTGSAWNWGPHFYSGSIGWISDMNFKGGSACGLAE